MSWPYFSTMAATAEAGICASTCASTTMSSAAGSTLTSVSIFVSKSANEDQLRPIAGFNFLGGLSEAPFEQAVRCGPLLFGRGGFALHNLHQNRYRFIRVCLRLCAHRPLEGSPGGLRGVCGGGEFTLH